MAGYFPDSPRVSFTHCACVLRVIHTVTVFSVRYELKILHVMYSYFRLQKAKEFETTNLQLLQVDSAKSSFSSEYLELDIDNKLKNFLKITGILNNVFRPQKILKKTRIKLYNTLALPVLLYGSETWTNKASDARRITAAVMKYMRRTAGYTWDNYKTNAQIAKELKITQILDKLLEYKRRWMQHVNRIPRNRLPRVTKYYSPTGRRSHGRPLKRFLDT